VFISSAQQAPARILQGQEIPAELYRTVAEFLAFVYKVNEQFRHKLKS
jgi:type III secretion system FlhB-like substrate exporter